MSTNHSPEYFLNQESFKNWVLGQNEDDCQFWDAWVKNNPNDVPVAMLAARMLTGISTDNSDIRSSEIEEEWMKLKSRIEQAENGQFIQHSIFPKWVKYAAAAMLLVAIGWLIRYLATPVEVNYATNYSAKKNIELSDGTEIVLNANSNLTTRSTWKFAAPREIWLDGEAYFKVKSHENNPVLKNFVVHTRDLDVHVVGTQFNVNTRKQSTKVYLEEGKVRLSLKKSVTTEDVMMDPGDMVNYSAVAKDKGVVKEKKPAEVAVSWKSGYFTFDKTPIREAIQMVEATHGFRIEVSNPALLDEVISGKVPSHDINELLQSMSKLFSLEYEIDGKNILLKENGKVSKNAAAKP